jgi:hypothetical protein
MAETRRETDEGAVSTDPVTGETVITDPVSGEILPIGPVQNAAAPSNLKGVEESAVYTGGPVAVRRLQTYRVQQAVYLVFSVIEGLIAIRFGLEVLGANPAAGFASFIYSVSDIFMAPFAGLLNESRLGGSVIEWSALVAIAVYGLLSWLLVRLAWLLGSHHPYGATRTTR